MRIGQIQFLRLLSRDTNGYRNPGSPQNRDPSPHYRWVGIAHGNHNATHAGAKHCRNTGGSPLPQMTAGLKGDIQSRSFCARPCMPESENFCVRMTWPTVESFSNDPPMSDDQGTNHRIGADRALALRRQTKSLCHVQTISVLDGHRFLRAMRDRLLVARAEAFMCPRDGGDGLRGFAFRSARAAWAAASLAMATR